MHLLEIVEARLKRSSTIFCSQFAPEGVAFEARTGPNRGRDSRQDPYTTLHDSYKILVDGETSMKERHGLGIS